jgi:hypothetical protein
MKEKIKNHIGNFHLYILTGLVLVFFGVLFLSTAFKDTSENYIFKEEVLTSNFNDITLGQITLTNNGPITAKIQLKNLVACDGKTTADIEFAGTNLDRYGYSGSKSIEISSKDTQEIQILLNYYNYDYDLNGNKKNTTELDLYIYELEKDAYTYGYCNTVINSEAFANVKVKLEK